MGHDTHSLLNVLFRASLGVYRAIGMINGRWVYQKPGEDRYLEYGNKYWIASTGVGKTSGHIHNSGQLFSSVRLSVCLCVHSVFEYFT